MIFYLDPETKNFFSKDIPNNPDVFSWIGWPLMCSRFFERILSSVFLFVVAALDLEPSPLNCANCTLTFLNAWDLVQHCQGEHSLNIYKTSSQVGFAQALHIFISQLLFKAIKIFCEINLSPFH